MKFPCILTIALVFPLTFVLSAQTKNEKTPVEYVNPFIGTGGEGHTYPGATVPFGMVQLSPDSRTRFFRQSFPYCAGYRYEDSVVSGFSHTHFSGTGHSDLGDVLVMPYAGNPDPQEKERILSGYTKDSLPLYYSKISHSEEKASPGYYMVELKTPGIKAELTATTRTGFHRYTYKSGQDAAFILDLVSSIYNYDGKVIFSQIRVENNQLITGYRQTNGWAVNRYIYFAIEFSQPFYEFYVVNMDKNIKYNGFGKKGSVYKDFPEVNGKKLKAWFAFGKLNTNDQLMVKVGVSAVSIEGARANMLVELPAWNFDAVHEAAEQLWKKELAKIYVNGSEREKEIFYTAHYHTMLSPVVYNDADGSYRGLDNCIHSTKQFTNYTIFSLWDTYRALHPLFTITQKDRVGDMITSMLEHQKQSAFKLLPVWSFHANESWCMIGYHAVSVITDAYMKGIRNFEFRYALDAMLATATNRNYGGIESYMKYGFVPIDLEKEGVSKTLEYAYDDWCISQYANALGQASLFNTFYERSRGFEKLYDAKTGFMRAKNSDGKWREPFDPLYAQYGGDYTEGNAYQYSWYVPQDIPALVKLHGGNKKFAEDLDKVFDTQASKEQFKQVEDIAGLIGQYAQGNEPSHHIAYLYNYAGMPWKTQERLNQIMKHLFDNTPQGICGNDDCGQMSAWYIFSSMGFYPVCPGSNQYIIGKPAIPYARIELTGKKTFIIEAKNLSPENIYIKSVKLNGHDLGRIFITHEDIISGGILQFEMVSKPVK